MRRSHCLALLLSSPQYVFPFLDLISPHHIALQLECAIDEWQTGTFTSISFTAKQYEKSFKDHLKSLQDWLKSTTEWGTFTTQKVQKALWMAGR